MKNDKVYSNSVVSYYISYITDIKEQYKKMSMSIKKELEGHICILCEDILFNYKIIECGHFVCDDCIDEMESCICGNKNKNVIFSLK